MSDPSTIPRNRRRVAILAGLAGLLLAGCAGEPAARSREATASPNGGHTATAASPGVVDITCGGTGSPTVLLEAGLGEDSSSWSDFLPQLPSGLRVCTSSRAGLGASPPLDVGDPDPSPGGAAGQLYDALAAAGEEGPFLPVGFSYGGMVAQAFAASYADEVVGLVLDDSADPGEFTDGPWQRLGIDWSEGGRSIDQAAATQQLTDLDLGGIPVFVVTQDQLPRRLDRLWTAYHQRQAAQSTQSAHVRALGSGHAIQQDNPALLAAAIDEVVAAARGEQALRPCDRRFAPLHGTCVPAG